MESNIDAMEVLSVLLCVCVCLSVCLCVLLCVCVSVGLVCSIYVNVEPIIVISAHPVQAPRPNASQKHCRFQHCIDYFCVCLPYHLLLLLLVTRFLFFLLKIFFFIYFSFIFFQRIAPLCFHAGCCKRRLTRPGSIDVCVYCVFTLYFM